MPKSGLSERRKSNNKRRKRLKANDSSSTNQPSNLTEERDSTGKRRNPQNEIQRHLIPQEPLDEDRFYVIERLLDKRINAQGQEEYLVRWQNYPPDWDSWEPREELERNSSDMVNEFNRKTNGQLADDKLHCICRRVYRFDQGGMIQCLNCKTWFHFNCLQMNMEQANNYAKYYCHECRILNSSLKNEIKLNKLNTYYGISMSQDDSQ